MKIRELTGRNINGTEHERNDGMTEVTETTEQRNGRVWENGLGKIIHNTGVAALWCDMVVVVAVHVVSSVK
jgi:hypothetical protein